MNKAMPQVFSPEHKLSKLIQHNSDLLFMLQHFNIHLPLQDKTIANICAAQNISEKLFITIANLYNNNSLSPVTDLPFTDANTLLLFLKNSHVFYSEELYPKILDTIEAMAKVNTHKEMVLVQKFFIDYFNEVTEHLAYENKIVFPYVLSLLKQIENPKAPNQSNSNYTVSEYKEHHNDIEEKLIDLKNLLIKYLPEQDDQTIRRKLFFKLSKLESDLAIHSNIEDLLLIPLVAKMENYLKDARK